SPLERSKSEKQLVLRDDAGLQGRLNEILGRPRNHQLQMADFKASIPEITWYREVPDLVVINDSSAIKFQSQEES
ncbi:uncharacterized protein N7487_002601, partial [Penicillium crustosum]|uniref:uncharacterized protein n=1 Tax=Penicillium crustosum TaxID=36656 RepID=UPI00239CC92D